MLRCREMSWYRRVRWFFPLVTIVVCFYKIQNNQGQSSRTLVDVDPYMAYNLKVVAGDVYRSESGGLSALTKKDLGNKTTSIHYYDSSAKESGHKVFIANGTMHTQKNGVLNRESSVAVGIGRRGDSIGSFNSPNNTFHLPNKGNSHSQYIRDKLQNIVHPSEKHGTNGTSHDPLVSRASQTRISKLSIANPGGQRYWAKVSNLRDEGMGEGKEDDLFPDDSPSNNNGVNSNTLCKLPKATPFSASMVEKLFLSDPIATCDHQRREDICTVFVMSGGIPRVRCRSDLCHSNITLGVLHPGGALHWARVTDTSHLETSITSLIRTRQGLVKHADWCYVRCEAFVGPGVGDKIITQLLIFPPRVTIRNLPHPKKNVSLTRRGLPHTSIDDSHLVRNHPATRKNAPYQKRNVTNTSKDVFHMVRDTTQTSRRGVPKKRANTPKTEIDAKAVTQTPPISINLIHLDSMSRAHFLHTLPQSVATLKSLTSNSSSSSMKVLDFELLQTIKARTFESLQVLFTGELPKDVDLVADPGNTDEVSSNSRIAFEQLFKQLKAAGYSIMYNEDMCWESGWGLVKYLGVDPTGPRAWSEFMEALDRNYIDDYGVSLSSCELFRINGVKHPFHGPPAVCLNGQYQHQYTLQYLEHYQKAMHSLHKPYFSLVTSDVAHEPTGQRARTLDAGLSNYLESAARLDNVLTIVTADHGLSYGDFVQQTLQGRIEMFNPVFYMILPQAVTKALKTEWLRAMELNQQRLITFLDLHLFLRDLIKLLTTKEKPRTPEGTIFEAPISAHVTKTPYQDNGKVTHGGGLHIPLPSNTSCNDIPTLVDTTCICDGHSTRAAPQPLYELLATFGIEQINNLIQRQRGSKGAKSPIQSPGAKRPVANTNVMRRPNDALIRAKSPAYNIEAVTKSLIQSPYAMRVAKIPGQSPDQAAGGAKSPIQSTGCLSLALHKVLDVWVSHRQGKRSVKMNVQILPRHLTVGNNNINNMAIPPETWTLSVQWRPGSFPSNMTLTSVTRLAQYGRYRACADRGVYLKFCLCALSGGHSQEQTTLSHGQWDSRNSILQSNKTLMTDTRLPIRTPGEEIPGSGNEMSTSSPQGATPLTHRDFFSGHNERNGNNKNLFKGATSPAANKNDSYRNSDNFKSRNPGFYLGKPEMGSINDDYNTPDRCLNLIIRRNSMGAAFWVHNACKVPRRLSLSLSVSNMDVSLSDRTSTHYVPPWQLKFMAIAAQSSPNMDFHWKYTAQSLN